MIHRNLLCVLSFDINTHSPLLAIKELLLQPGGDPAAAAAERLLVSGKNVCRPVPRLGAHSW